jgi:hypothetical protein
MNKEARMRKLLFLALIGIVSIGISIQATDIQAQSTSDPNVCFKTCIETYGSSKKQACALQCGFGTGSTGGKQGRDCGSIYKQCLAQCGSDGACKSTCRKQRTQCF